MGPDRHGIFAGDDPFALAVSWLEAAEAAEPNDPNAAALATVDADGAPNVRIVLIKSIVAPALRFYTNYDSDKAREISATGEAALAFHWKSLRRQMRVRGAVTKADDAEADAYYASRSLGSRIGAWASPQSQPIPERNVLEARVAEAAERFGDDPPRPPHWGGFRIEPRVFEFWADGENRLHDRFRWTKLNTGWSVSRLGP